MAPPPAVKPMIRANKTAQWGENRGENHGFLTGFSPHFAVSVPFFSFYPHFNPFKSNGLHNAYRKMRKINPITPIKSTFSHFSPFSHIPPPAADGNINVPIKGRIVGEKERVCVIYKKKYLN